MFGPRGRFLVSACVAAVGLLVAAGARAQASPAAADTASSYCSATSAFGQALGRGLTGRNLVAGNFQNWIDPARRYRPFDHFSATLTEKTRRLIGIDATRGYSDPDEAKAAYGALIQALTAAGLSEQPPSRDQADPPNTQSATFVAKDSPGALEIEVSVAVGGGEALLEMNCRSPAMFRDAFKEWAATP
jgi:hypothetical protein